jgi:7-cyano-7-deazaguanine reductase
LRTPRQDGGIPDIERAQRTPGLVAGACSEVHRCPSLPFSVTPPPAPASPSEALLERVPNPEPGLAYLVRFACPEFTSLCPVTGQPDFAHLLIDYVPGDWLVESKALKLFLASFRNHGGFHESCTLLVAKRIIAAIEPSWLRIGGYWYPRGGMPIDVFWQTGTPPEGLWLPDQGVPAYRGR